MLMDLIKALQSGETLKDPKRWKKSQNLTNAVGAILILALKYLDIDLPEETVSGIVEAVVGILVAVNIYLTTATTKKVGV